MGGRTRHGCNDENSTREGLDPDFIRALADILHDAAEVGDLRACIVALQAKLEDLHSRHSILIVELANERSRRTRLEEILLQRHKDSHASLSPCVSAMSRTVGWLPANGVCAIDAACRDLHAEVDRSDAWKTLCLKHFQVDSLSCCSNFKLALASREARRILKYMRAEHIESARRIHSKHAQEVECLKASAMRIVRWTIPAERITSSRTQREPIYTPYFEVAGLECFFRFHPGQKAAKKKARESSKFHIALPKGAIAKARVFLADGEAHTLWLKKEAKCDDGTVDGFVYCGWELAEEPLPLQVDKPLRIQVEFCELHKAGIFDFLHVTTWKDERHPLGRSKKQVVVADGRPPPVADVLLDAARG